MLRPRRVASLLAMTLAALIAAEAAAQGLGKSLPVSLLGQETEQWCWAASGQMIMLSLGATVDVRQCTQACKEFTCLSCCDQSPPDNCVKGGWPEFEKYGFSAQYREWELSWEELVAEIDAGRPVAFSWWWTSPSSVGAAGHMMVAYGYDTTNGAKTVRVWDPLPVGSGDAHDMSYDEYVQGPDHSHWRDYYAIGRAATPIVTAAASRPAAVALFAADGWKKDNGPAKAKAVTVPAAQAIQQSRSAAMTALRQASAGVEVNLMLDTNKSWKGKPPVLGDPLPVIQLMPGDLLAAEGAAAAAAKVSRKLLEPFTSHVLWAIKPNAQAKASDIVSALDATLDMKANVAPKKEVWKAYAGGTNLVRLLAQTQEAYQTAHPEAKGNFSAVRLRGLNIDFVGFVPEGKSETLLIPTRTITYTPPEKEGQPKPKTITLLNKGVPLSPKEVIEKLKPKTESFKGNAPT